MEDQFYVEVMSELAEAEFWNAVNALIQEIQNEQE